MTREQRQIAARARAAVRTAIRRGELTPGRCARMRPWTYCAGRIEAHHEDYSRPLSVVWLCRRHHVDLHYARRIGAAA